MLYRRLIFSLFAFSFPPSFLFSFFLSFFIYLFIYLFIYFSLHLYLPLFLSHFLSSSSPSLPFFIPSLPSFLSSPSIPLFWSPSSLHYNYHRHGNLSQSEQKSVFEVARNGVLKIVVATNVAEVINVLTFYSMIRLYASLGIFYYLMMHHFIFTLFFGLMIIFSIHRAILFYDFSWRCSNLTRVEYCIDLSRYSPSTSLLLLWTSLTFLTKLN